MTIHVLPDPIEAVRSWLLSVTEVTALVSTRVTTRLPGTVTWPAVRLQRVGGEQRFPERLGTAEIDVSVWDDSEPDCHAVAYVVEAAMFALGRENYTTDDCVIAGVEQLLGPTSIPDTTRTPPTPRVQMTFAVHFHPNP